MLGTISTVRICCWNEKKHCALWEKVYLDGKVNPITMKRTKINKGSEVCVVWLTSDNALSKMVRLQVARGESVTPKWIFFWSMSINQSIRRHNIYHTHVLSGLSCNGFCLSIWWTYFGMANKPCFYSCNNYDILRITIREPGFTKYHLDFFRISYMRPCTCVFVYIIWLLHLQ